MEEFRKAFRISRWQEDRDWLEFGRHILFYWLGIMGILGWIGSFCDLTFLRLVSFLAALLFVLLIEAIDQKTSYSHHNALLIAVAVILAVLLLSPAVQSGISGLCHDAYLSFAKRGVHFIYKGSAVDSTAVRTFVMFLASCWVYLFIKAFREFNKIPMFAFFLLMILLEMRFGDGEGTAWIFVCFLWILSDYLTSMRAFLGVGVPLMALGAAFLLIFGVSSESGWENIWEKVRYSENSSVLPDGDLEKAGHMSRKDKTVISLDISEPGYYYLKGFVGTVYSDNAWQQDDSSLVDLETGIVGGNDEFLSWLHEKGYSGWNELSDITGATGNTSITIKNVGASRKYLYLPYELKTEVRTIADERLGTFFSGESLLAAGTFGKKKYKIITASSLAGKEITASDKNNATKTKAYDAYEEYVQRTCLTLPRDVKKYITDQLGGSKTVGVDDTLAIAKKVRNWLSKNVEYSENPGTVPSNMEFVQWFLSEHPKGYDVQYASLAVMLFRYYGIPARYVEGYLVENESDVSQTSAHAWPEIFLSGRGWVPVEVMDDYETRMPSYMEEDGGTIHTSDNELEEEKDSSSNSQSQNDAQNSNNSKNTQKDSESVTPVEQNHNIVLVILAVLLALILLTLLIIFMVLRIREFIFRQSAVRSIAPERTIIMWYQYCIWLIYELESDSYERTDMMLDNRMLRWEERWIKKHPRVNKKALHQTGLLRQKAIYRKEGITWQEAEPAIRFFRHEYRYLFKKLTPERKLRVRLGLRPSFLKKN